MQIQICVILKELASLWGGFRPEISGFSLVTPSVISAEPFQDAESDHAQQHGHKRGAKVPACVPNAYFNRAFWTWTEAERNFTW